MMLLFGFLIQAIFVAFYFFFRRRFTVNCVKCANIEFRLKFYFVATMLKNYIIEVESVRLT